MRNIGVQSIGIKCPIIKEGDDIVNIVVDSVLKSTAVYDNGYDFSNDEPFYYDIDDKDIIGITESVVARANGSYLKIDDLATEIAEKIPSKVAVLLNPIYSRNRFSLILKAFARACNKIYIVMPEYDEVGNPRGLNPCTGVDISAYYKSLCETENCECNIIDDYYGFSKPEDVYDCGTRWCENAYFVDCSLRPKNHPSHKYYLYTLKDFGTNVNLNYGLLGSNKANEDTLKLFPTVGDSMRVCTSIKRVIKEKINKNVEVMIYGDGCFKDATSGIWEFADPDVSPFYTEGLDGSPNEIKLKEFADNKYANLSGDELNNAIKNEISNKKSDLVGSMTSQGTTPRKYINLLASLMDLTSGSGDKGTPVVLVKNYFNNYSN